MKQEVQTLIEKSPGGSKLYLLQNSPNPFAQTTMVRCYVPSSVKQAKLSAYSVNGQLVRSITLTSGMNHVDIAAHNLAVGEYSYSLIVDGQTVLYS